MKHIYDCKNLCKKLGDCCHNTKNRVIEKMCDCDKNDCKPLGNYLQSLMILESLCNYICVCCCEHESLSSSIMTELNSKCATLSSQADKLLKQMDKKNCEYIRCNELKKMCSDCKSMKKKKTHKNK